MGEEIEEIKEAADNGGWIYGDIVSGTALMKGALVWTRSEGGMEENLGSFSRILPSTTRLTVAVSLFFSIIKAVLITKSP